MGSWRRRRPVVLLGGLLTAVLASLLPSVPYLSARPVQAAAPVRVVIVGDSLTQGSAGDWTWRYFLWKHLAATATAGVDFVGPWTDLRDQSASVFGNHDYIDPAFDQDHASKWGLSFSFPEQPIGDIVTEQTPDVIVETLGLADLVYLGQTPEQVAGSVRKFVLAARP